MDTISFNNKQFPIREIELPNLGMVFISINSLNDIIFNMEGGYISDEAEAVDEMIFYYVNDNEITLPENALINLLLLEVI